MNVRTLILAILNHEEATGYEIKKLSTEGVYSYFVDISYGSIYPTLSRLEAEGMVTVRAEQQDGKPSRKVYSITEAGRAEFVQSLLVPPAPDKFKSEFLLVALTAELGTTETITRAIDERIAYLESALSTISDHLKKSCGNKAERSTFAWVCEYGRSIKEFDLTYLKNNRDLLISSAGKASSSDTHTPPQKNEKVSV